MTSVRTLLISDDAVREWSARAPRSSLPTQPTPWPSRRQRALVGAGIVLAHVVMVGALMLAQPLPGARATDVTTLVFIAPPEVVPVLSIEAPLPPRPTETARPVAAPVPRPASPRPVPRQSAATEVPASPGPPVVADDATDSGLRLRDADGSLALPDDVVDRLQAVDEGTLAFGFQQPGFLEEGRFMRRPPVLEYEATQFDQYWKPEHDLLTALLEKAVAAMSDQVEVRMPGSNKRLLCKISLLAAGGTCQLVGGGGVVELDDPDTLDREEDAQCKAWWERIASPGSQADWKYTRALYEFQCRKPPEIDLDPP